MKEHIYSIPLTEALEENQGCILCTLEKKLEEQVVEYFLGPSMMEPDSREITNEKGFCKRHMGMLFDKKNRLSLALMLETHVKELEKNLDTQKKSGLFSKESHSKLLSEGIYKKISSCALCDKLDSQMRDAAGNLCYLWDKDEDFRKMFESSEGLCLEHMALAAKMCEKEIAGKKKEEFLAMMTERQKEKLSSLYNDLHEFTLSFDYRNADKELTSAQKESVHTAVKHLTKY